MQRLTVECLLCNSVWKLTVAIGAVVQILNQFSLRMFLFQSNEIPNHFIIQAFNTELHFHLFIITICLNKTVIISNLILLNFIEIYVRLLYSVSS